MIEMDLGDPKTTWLTVTNVAMAVVTLLCFVVVGWGAAAAAFTRWRRRRSPGLVPDAHVFAAPGLGLTMADGGRKLDGGKKP